MSVCQGCGVELPPSRGARPRKWCSERCRKGQYAGTCVDCGAPTEGSEGRGPNAPERCRTCQLEHLHTQRRDLADVREAEVAALYRQGLPAWRVAQRLGLSVPATKSLAQRAREHGLDCPYAPLGGRAHRGQVAA